MFAPIPSLILLTIGFSTGTESVLDDFHYATSSEVRKSWTELKGTLPLAMQRSNGKKRFITLGSIFLQSRDVPRRHR